MLRLLRGVGAQRRALPLAARALCQAEPARRSVGVGGDQLRTRRKLLQSFDHAVRSAQEAEEVPVAVYQLLRRCGTGLQLERPGMRVKVAEEMMAAMKTKGLKVDIGMYNTLLLVYLQNEHVFVPSEFMERLKQEDLSPNTGTLQALLEAYCQHGNLAGATQLLEHMGSQDVPINEHVYSHLIQAHARSGDMDSAAGMLQVMKDNGLPPGGVAYSALLLAHAERGDMEGIKQLMSSMREEHVFPSLAVFARLLDTLSRSGHNQHIPQVLEMIRNKQWMQSDLRNLVSEFAVRGEVSSALLLLRRLADMGAAPHNTPAFTLVRSMLQSGRGCSDTMETVSELVEMGFTQELFEELLGWYYRRMPNVLTEMTVVLEGLLEQRVELKPHYFYPVLVHPSTDLPGAVAMVKRMLEGGFKCDKFMIAALVKKSPSVEELIKVFQEAGILEQAAGDFIVGLCSSARFADALLFMREVGVEGLPTAEVLASINAGIRLRMSSEDVGSVVSLYSRLAPALMADRVGELEHSLQLAVGHLTFCKDLATATALVSQLEEEGLDVGETGYKKLLVGLLVGHFSSESNNAFMKVIAAMKQRGYELGDSENALLLKVASQSCDVHLTVAALERLEGAGAEVPLLDLCSAITTLAQYPKHLPMAYKLYQRVVESEDKPLYEAFSSLAIALVQSGDLHTAEHMLQSMPSFGFHGSARLYNSFMEAYAHRGEVDKLTAMLQSMLAAEVAPTEFSFALVMEGYAQHGAVENILELVKQVEERGMAVNRRMLSVLMEAHIARREVVEAMAAMRRYPRVVPKLQVLAKLFRQLCISQGAATARGGGGGVSPGDSPEGEEEVRAEVVELMGKTKASGEVVDDILFYCYLEGGMLDEARRIMAQDGFQLRADNFLRFVCKAYDSRQFECAQRSVQLAREGGFHKSNESFAVALVNAHRYMGDKTGITEIEQELREQASDKFKAYIEKVLKTTKYRHH